MSDEKQPWQQPPRYLLVSPDMEARLTPLDERPLQPCKETPTPFAGADAEVPLDLPGLPGSGPSGTGLE